MIVRNTYAVVIMDVRHHEALTTEMMICLTQGVAETEAGSSWGSILDSATMTAAEWQRATLEPGSPASRPQHRQPQQPNGQVACLHRRGHGKDPPGGEGEVVRPPRGAWSSNSDPGRGAGGPRAEAGARQSRRQSGRAAGRGRPGRPCSCWSSRESEWEQRFQQLEAGARTERAVGDQERGTAL